MQHEIEIKHAQEERKREMAAETAAREKVRLQIAQDKLERKQKELALQVSSILTKCHSHSLTLTLKFNFILTATNATTTAMPRATQI